MSSGSNDTLPRNLVVEICKLSETNFARPREQTPLFDRFLSVLLVGGM
jgi:hypothetical protein